VKRIAVAAAAVVAFASALAACEVDVPLGTRTDGPLPTDASGFVDAPLDALAPDAIDIDAAFSIDAALD
jgi:hypothetical protein